MPQEFADGPENTSSTMVIRAKGVMDGARTLSGAAECLESHAAWLSNLEAKGYQLAGPVEDDYGYAALAEPEI
ncbi:hypothetical protein [Arthrobacter mobilis]|uniref:Uncharacterized protein n=1 Tax=Arthrobacter mobilis TaxID=2724944 RepID=A0A7X6K753_9MICC|nr:hypothetical protein [Arthrobacter mobilis]NKX56393.1 hypothetical protein [Arthrobacter mobilis]